MSDTPLTPHDLAVKHGHTREQDRTVVKFREQDPHVRRYSWQHLAADALHGWSAHTEHTQEPVLLSDEDYLSALIAVESKPIAPHEPANMRKIKADEKFAAKQSILRTKVAERAAQRARKGR